MKKKNTPPQAFNPTLAWKRELVDRYFQGTPVELTDELSRWSGERDKTVVHIAARSGSTRLEDKNIKRLCGVPLIAYTILVARGLGADRVIVNTDSPRYARIAESYGAEVPFLRPPELSSDTAPPGMATYYAQKFLLGQGYPLESWIDLYPTSPFRNVEQYVKYLQSLLDAGSFSTVSLPRSPFANLYSSDMTRVLEEADDHEQSTIFYKRTGNMLGHKLSLKEIKWRHYEAINNPIELIDIDTEEDFALAAAVIESDAYDFGVSIC